jgi:hypothetical protein
MELKAMSYINPAQAVSIDNIYKTEFKKKCSYAPLGSEERCSFNAYISPFVDDNSVYIRLKWSYQNDEGFIGVAEKYYCVEQFGLVKTLEEKYPSWGFEERMNLITKLQKLDWL